MRLSLVPRERRFYRLFDQHVNTIPSRSSRPRSPASVSFQAAK
jgi:hypothetical protein